MLGPEKFLEYFYEAWKKNPYPFMRKNDKSYDYETILKNLQTIKLGYIYCFSGRVKEYLVIPKGFTSNHLFVLFLSGSHQPRLRAFTSEFNLRLRLSWLNNLATPVEPQDLPLYVNHPYKSSSFETMLRTGCKFKLPYRKGSLK
jgi:hypothetical protein